MASTVWNGSVDTDWNTAANWTPSGVPLASAHIQISTTNDCALDQSRSCASLTIDSGATLIGGGYKLTVTSEGDAASGTEGFAVNNDGIISGNLDLEINTTTATDIDLAGTSGNFRDLRLNDASCDVTMKADCTLDGTLVIAAGQLSTGTGGYGFSNLTVAGNCTVSAGATLEGNASSGATVRLLSLTVNGTYSATGGETIITGETGAGRAVDIVGTFTHNSGTLSIQTPADTLLRWPSSSSAYHIRINDASCIARPTGDNKPLIAGNLTISAGEFNTLEGGQDHALTVTGKTEITTGTLTLNGSTCLLNSGGTAGGLVLNANATVLADADSTVTMGSIEAGYDSSINIRLAGTNTINNYRSSTDKTMKLPPGVVDPVSSTTSFTVTTSATNTEVSAVNLVNLTFTPASGTPNFNLDSGYGGIDIEGDLTINTGATITSNNQAITVVGEVNVAGTLDCGSSVCSFGSLDSTGLTELADSSGSTLITNENSDGLSIVAGTFGTCVPAKIKHNNGTVTFNNHSDPAAHAAIVVGNSNATDGLYNAIIDGANTIVDTYDPGGAGQECKIHNNFTVTNGSFQVNGASNPFDVGGNVLVSAGKMFGDGSAPTGAMSFGSLTIESGAEFRATSATTTITNKNGSNYIIDIDGIFTHNSGTVYIDTSVTGDKLLDLIPSSGVGLNHLIVNEDGSGVIQYNGNTTIAGDLTIEEGTLHGYDYNNSELTVTGGVTIEDGGTLGVTNQTGAYSFGSLTINSGGTFIATSGETSITGAGGLSRAGTFTHNNGTVDFEAATTVIQSTTMTGSNAFYILKSTGTTWYRIDQDIDIERHASTGYVFWFYGDVTVTMGTDTHSSGTDNSNKCIGWTYVYGHTSSTYKLYAKNELYPWLYDYPNVGNSSWINGSQDARMGIAHLKGGNIIGDFTIAETTNPKSIVCDGDMEFDGVTVGNTNTLDLNGQRAVFGGAFDLTTGALAMNDAMAVFTNTIDFNGRVPTSNTGTTIIHNPPSTSEKLITSLYFGGTFFAQGAESDVNGYAWGGSSGEYPAKVFVGGQLDCQQSVKTSTTMQVAIGGELRGNDRTITVEEDFTTSGGLIGKSALNLTGAEEVTGSDNLDEVATTNKFTIEAWFKASTDANYRAIFSRGTSWSTGNLYVYMNGDGNVQASANDLSNTLTSTTAGLADGKWHHVAYTYDTTTISLYIDGKLEATAASTTGINTQTAGFKIGDRDGANWVGNIGRVSVWKNALSETLIRKMLFMDWTTMAADSDFTDSDAIGWWQFDEGTGTAVEDLSSQSNDGTLNSAAWAGTGTFTMGTSTLDFTGNGQWALSDTTTDYYNVKVAASGKTTTINSVGGSEKRPRINNLLTHGGGTLTDISNADITFYGTGSHTAGADLSGLYITYWPSSTDMPGGTYQYLITQHNDLSTTGNINCGGYFAVSSGEGFDLKTHTLTTGRMILYANSTFNIDAGSLIFDSTSGMTGDYTGRTFTAGPGATITGVAAKSGFFSGNNYSVVGKIENLDVTNEELKVTGQVINCTGDIHQYFPTIDHNQQLDADTADDRDVRLGRDMDANTELINS